MSIFCSYWRDSVIYFMSTKSRSRFRSEGTKVRIKGVNGSVLSKLSVSILKYRVGETNDTSEVV